VEAGDLWKSSKAVLVFLRHFACIACRAHAAQVWAHREVYEKSQTKVVFIGNGPPGFIRQFKEDLGLEGATIYTDPSLESFRHCGLKRGFFELVSYRSVANAVTLYNQGYRQLSTKHQGDPWQLGGIVVVTPDNRVAYHFVSEALGDFPAAGASSPS